MKKKIFTVAFAVVVAASVMFIRNMSTRSNADCADIMMSNIEALSRGEGGEQACIEAKDRCPFHGLFIADSRVY